MKHLQPKKHGSKAVWDLHMGDRATAVGEAHRPGRRVLRPRANLKICGGEEERVNARRK